MKHLLSLLLATCLIITTGCSSVDFSHPIGHVINDAETPGLGDVFNGTWVTTPGTDQASETIYLHYHGHGWIEAVGIEVNKPQGDTPQARRDTVPPSSLNLGDRLFVQLRKSGGDRWFLNLIENDDTKIGQQSYSLMLLKNLDTPDQLVLWTSVPQAFRNAIENDKIVGTIEQRDDAFTAHVTADSESVLAWLGESNMRKAFHYENPVILRRVAR